MRITMVESDCPHCGGSVQFSPEADSAFCPHCQSNFMIPQSDRVKIQRILSNTELEKMRIQRQIDQDKNEDFHRTINKLLIAMAVCIGLMILIGIIPH